ncbi:Calx-beta domain-containing protein [Anabaena lutea]|uniref:Calx-beta domain-containing protein n=1 Tax=Anabaena lutea TaxID=212350 RepID=UPI0018EF8280|nr:Calx-beta domain-containing protein [Anabaena lutea]
MNTVLRSVLALTYDQLSIFAGLENFWNLFDTTFGTQYDRTVAVTLRSQWQAGDFSQLPQIEILDSSILGNANGAYASSTNKIYLSNSFLANATPTAVSAVLLEEIGHYVDAHINQTDSAGDEGAIFAELVQGNSLDTETLQTLKAEDDHATITVDGQVVAVEQNSGTIAFSAATYSVNENGTPVTAVTVTRTGGSIGIVSATLNLTNGTASAPFDYQNTPITVNFANGETTKTVNFSQVSQGLSFDGVNDYVNVGAKSSLEVSNAITIEAWINPTGGGSEILAGGIIVNKEGEYEVARFSDGTIQWAFANDNPSWTFINTNYVAPLNQWTHIAVSYDLGVIKTYANGVLVHTYNGSGNLGDIHVNQDDFRIGGRQEESQFFQGSIDDVRIWNRARTQAEIQANLNKELTGAESGLVGYWNFNSIKGNTVDDLTSNQNDGTIIEAQTTTGFGAIAGTIPIINDNLIEGNETVNLTLTNPTNGATIGTQNQAKLTIVDNDIPNIGNWKTVTNGGFETGDLNGWSNTSGENLWTITSDRSISGNFSAKAITNTAFNGPGYALQRTVTGLIAGEKYVLSGFIYTGGLTSGNTYLDLNDIANDPNVGAGDSSQTSLNIQYNLFLTFLNGIDQWQFVWKEFVAPSNQVTVRLVRDGEVKAGESAYIDDVAITPISQFIPLISSGVLAFSNTTYSLKEDGTAIASVTVNRTGGSNGAVSARINFKDGTAKATSDYNNTPITVNFADGEISKTITIPIVNDTTPELDETLQLTLTNPTGGATIGQQNSASLTIIDNDATLLITGLPQGSSGSNKGQTTIVISGQNFAPNDQISLISPTGTPTTASKVYWVNETEAWATFNLQGLATGKYDVKVTNGQNSSVVNDIFTVTNGAVGNIQTQLSYPANGVVTVKYTNVGQTDVVAPLFRITPTNAQVTYPEENTVSATLRQLLNLYLGTSENGPSGILAPGESGEFSFAYTPNGNGLINFAVTQVQPNEVINWASIKTETRADYSFIDNAAWDAIWSNLTANLGTTAGQFQTVMTENANYLSQLGQETSDLTRLFAFEWKQAVNTLTNVSLISTTDVVDAAPGLSLTFNRTFYQSIAERYNLGSLGRGWASQWDLRATTDSKGNVIIRSVGDLQRVFEKQTDGVTYLEDGGATLTITNGQYRLKEANGLISLFGTDGKLSYVQDTNGNKITLQYTNNRLTKLVHTNGDSLTLAYNAQGRISQITDSTGQITSYSYNASGENLLSVTSPDGTTTYTYDTGTVAAKKHSLLSVKSDLGYQRTFEYDNQGRLTKEFSNGQTQTLTYSYDNSTGGVTITDSTGASQTILLDDRGNGGQIRGVNNQNLIFSYDADGNLIGATLPNGSETGYTYDTNGNLTQQTNLLSQDVKFTYDAIFNQLTGFIDPKGNGVNYTYDTKGNLTKITYPDGSFEQFSVDALGNITSAINRRGNTIGYTYNTSGLLTKKQYADGSSVSYGYDTKGNLTSVTDATGTITMQYDSANQLTKITYPTGRSLTYTYNADGQRTKLVSQDGYTVNYTYDTVGRLKTLTNGTSQSIISYDYDNAGRLIKETNGNGTYTTYQYDQQSQLTQLINYKANNTVNSKFEYTYDNLGRRTSMTTLEGTFQYGYDATGQLISVVTPTNRTINYQYDAAGNRIGVTDNGTTTNYNTNNLNQYTNVGNAVYTYDTDGNVISKTEGGQTSTYTYDVENRLTKVVNAQGTWEYQYDGLGNRVATIFNGQKTEYLLDPFGLGDIVGEYNGSTLVANYTHGIGLVSRVNGSNSNYYDADALGSTIGLTATDGSYVNRYSYLPFGEDLTKVEGVANPFEYVGQWGVMDEGNGLDFMRARFYDSGLGRFTAVDPIGFNGGDTNFYRYVSNNPLIYFDPAGENAAIIAAAISAVGAIAVAIINNLSRPSSNGGTGSNNNGGTGNNNGGTVINNNGGTVIINNGGVINNYGGTVIPTPNPKPNPPNPTPPPGVGKGGGTGGNKPGSGPGGSGGGTGGGKGGGAGGGKGGGKGGSNGDPHLETFDGIKYDFQGAGEYTFVKSTTDDFEIQTRQQPWNGSTTVTVNTAIAIKAGGQRIALYLNDANPLKINGTAITLPNAELYAVGQNFITRSGNEYNIFTANGDQIQVTMYGNTYINISLGLADNRKGKVVGLLGNYNGTPNDDFALRNGTVIGGTITDQRLYGDYDDSWRITQANSLFDYTSGQSTTTFTDLNFPPSAITLTAQQRADAEQIARNAGITDPNLLENAIVDIALTNGAPEFIQGYVNLQLQSSNTLTNPDGLGTQHYLTANAVIPYTIRFANTAAAGTTPVAQVTITQTLDTDLDLNTFTLQDFGFGDITLDVPNGVQNYSQRLDLRSTRGVFVDVNAGLNTTTRVVTWTFTAINPTTGNAANSATQGFLPPNDQNGAGSGFVGYSVQPKANSANNTRVDAQASITFNSQTPIQTIAVFNTLDSNAPTSQVTALPANSNANFTVSWTGSDNGSGIASYDIYVATDGGQYVLWKDDITATSATYNGLAGKTYRFYSVATDNLGLTEIAPTLADATTTIGTIQPVINLSANQTIVEGFTSPQNVAYIVSLSNSSTQTITVQYLTSNGTAQAGSDYTSTRGTLTFNPGVTSQVINIPILNDSVNEANETFTLTLSNSTNATLGTSKTATTTITDTLTAFVTTTLPANVENLILTGNAAINGTGNSLNNTITGNGANNILNGGAGIDILIGGLGNDIYIVDSTTDTITELASQGTDTVQSSISYTLGTNVENLTLTGSAAINGTGNSLNNTITGNGANNILNGGAGIDILIGGLGNDIYIVDSTTDTITELASQGTDTVQSSISYTLGTNVENLTLTGSTAINGTGNSLKNIIRGNGANNILNGGAGNDLLQGLGGNDTLWGGLGDDVLTGGVGADQFRFQGSGVFNANLGVDYITDFAVGQDKIALSKATFNAITNAVGQALTNFAVVANDGLVDASTARIVYSQETGSIFYNQNANVLNAAAVFEFAYLGNPDITLSSSDFVLIA